MMRGIVAGWHRLDDSRHPRRKKRNDATRSFCLQPFSPHLSICRQWKPNDQWRARHNTNLAIDGTRNKRIVTSTATMQEEDQHILRNEARANPDEYATWDPNDQVRREYDARP
ncbi:hypothetical protein IAQ61_003289 [Plenodomus lingam]|uniref:uncharacterized protein n=1 Tax=Leptosphaeria maculans TaxID=5022 RepID=UPI003333FA23|nr:hypothetical protein IAQ61_003289 [Plenodomus lingam]